MHKFFGGQLALRVHANLWIKSFLPIFGRVLDCEYSTDGMCEMWSKDATLQNGAGITHNFSMIKDFKKSNKKMFFLCPE
jgi:hypothetical protein